MSDTDSDGEVEVIEVKAANTLVPNLTISVEKDDDEATVEFQDEDKAADVEDNDADSQVEVKLAQKSFTHTKIYENKLLKEIGFTAEDARARKKSRAKRFQSPLLRDEQEIEIDDDKNSIEDLVQKVKIYNEENDMFKEIRLDAVHLRGLDDMSTDDIFKFFADHFPSHIEWIDDTSCNVVWKDKTSAVGVVIAMLKPDRGKRTEKIEKQAAEAAESEGTKKVDDDELDLMESDDEKMEVEEESTPVADKPFENELRRCKRPFVKNGKKTFLQMRFANVNDKKTTGGANKSQYYRKYGNPNYGNVKGILSRSFKKRYHGRVAKREFEEFQPPEEVEKKQKVPSKRLYSEQAWMDAKRAKRNDSESSSDDDDVDAEKKRCEREDLELINSSAKDLKGSIPVTKEDEQSTFHSMEADIESRKEDAEKRSRNTSTNNGVLTVKVKGKGNIWDRLGNRSATDRKLQQDSTLPKSLQERLGTRRR